MLSSDHINKNQHTSQDNFHSTHVCMEMVLLFKSQLDFLKHLKPVLHKTNTTHSMTYVGSSHGFI